VSHHVNPNGRREVVGFDDFMCFEEPNGVMPVDEAIGAEEDRDLDVALMIVPIWLDLENTRFRNDCALIHNLQRKAMDSRRVKNGCCD
jgi:hypothetical protein